MPDRMATEPLTYHVLCCKVPADTEFIEGRGAIYRCPRCGAEEPFPLLFPEKHIRGECCHVRDGE